MFNNVPMCTWALNIYIYTVGNSTLQQVLHYMKYN